MFELHWPSAIMGWFVGYVVCFGVGEFTYQWKQRQRKRLLENVTNAEE